VPLVEAMRARLPVVAFRAGAIAETLGEGGVLLDSREPAPVATALLEVSSDDRLRAKIRDAQERECERFTVDKFRELLSALLDQCVAG
jgi:glycosyltransferase involved in cell wall biosynthesis